MPAPKKPPPFSEGQGAVHSMSVFPSRVPVAVFEVVFLYVQVLLVLVGTWVVVELELDIMAWVSPLLWLIYFLLLQQLCI